MIYIVCSSCNKGLRISGGDLRGDVSEAMSLFGPGSDMYPDAYPCFSCNEPAEFVAAADSDALLNLELFEVTPQEAMAALNGLGLPAEQDCSATAVQQALLSSPVKKVSARPIRNSHRSILDCIELEDGTKVYLGSSAYGATAYRISKPHSYAKGLQHD